MRITLVEIDTGCFISNRKIIILTLKDKGKKMLYSKQTITLFRNKENNNCESHNIFELAIFSLSILLLIMKEYLK